MAAAAIKFDKHTDVGRKKVRALEMIRDGYRLLSDSRASDIQLIDGATDQAANFDMLAAEGGYQSGDYADANAAAKASFDECDSLHVILTNQALAAINQCCAKHGV